MFVFKHPKYYKELRKLRNRAVQSSRTDSPQSDQVISSGSEGSALPQRAPGQGQTNKLQAASTKPQASSTKPQAPSKSKTLEQES